MTQRIKFSAATSLTKAQVQALTPETVPAFEDLPESLQQEISQQVQVSSQKQLDEAGVPVVRQFAMLSVQNYLLSILSNKSGAGVQRNFKMAIGDKGTVKFQNLRPGKWNSVWMYPAEVIELFVNRRQEVLRFISDNDHLLPRNLEEAQAMGYKDADGKAVPVENQNIKTRAEANLDLTPLVDPSLLSD